MVLFIHFYTQSAFVFVTCSLYNLTCIQYKCRWYKKLELPFYMNNNLDFLLQTLAGLLTQAARGKQHSHDPRLTTETVQAHS